MLWMRCYPLILPCLCASDSAPRESRRPSMQVHSGTCPQRCTRWLWASLFPQKAASPENLLSFSHGFQCPANTNHTNLASLPPNLWPKQHDLWYHGKESLFIVVEISSPRIQTFLRSSYYRNRMFGSSLCCHQPSTWSVHSPYITRGRGQSGNKLYVFDMV